MVLATRDMPVKSRNGGRLYKWAVVFCIVSLTLVLMKV